MSKFSKKSKDEPKISTAALPDIVFMLLFFFMVSTVFKSGDLLVKNSLPAASEITKLEKKSLVTEIYVGAPIDQAKYGKEPVIQLNGAVSSPDNIPLFVAQEKDKLDEAVRDKITMSLKVDREVKMGIISDIRSKLRDANALKVNYSANPGRPL
ncbi:ExbD/TolR family protein [Sediminitomix flava]|uniref:Biopolymer transport protein ExbD n=1 Tax=Sediminitomix flava TaxID=379075 RepID=A0A315ZBH3_SEDFL|nr:biopolymer transporter ExbD [Sediminitomix flava]PWJ42925.1 biopolymer transport protein ExbD [Sediminitomix flava]